jgi:NAD(P)H dehydrogenase (quinone)
MKDTAVQVFRERSDNIKVSDLYAMGFKAVADKQDFLQTSAPEDPYQEVQQTAFETNLLSPDIRMEVDKLFWADLIIFHFPIWWFSMPAIMKGWVDRVIIKGPLYNRERWYSTGVLKDKKALIAMTTGAPETAYCKTGINGYMEDLLFPIHHGIFHFLGMDVLDPFIVYSSAYISDKERKAKLDAYQKKLFCIEKASFTSPPDIALYDQATWKLRP